MVKAIDRYLEMRGYGEQRIEVLRSGIKAAQALGDRRDEGVFLGTLGIAYRELGEVEKAISYYEQALAISVEIGHRHGQGTHLGNLGLAYFQLGEVEQARDYLQQAFTIFSEIKPPNAALVQQWLEDLDQAS